MDGFKLGGRLNRTSFIIFFLILITVYTIVCWFWDANLALYVTKSIAASKKNAVLWEFIMGIEWTINLYLLYSLAMRRIRDVGKGVMLVDIFFPVYYIAMLCLRRAGNIFAELVLLTVMFMLAMPGSDAKKVNQYGDYDKGRNPLSYVIYGGLYLLILVLTSSLYLIMRFR